MVRGLIDIYRFEGWLPDCRMDLCKGFTQGGSNADVVLADTFVKGLTNGIDWETGYEAVLKDAQGEFRPSAVETTLTDRHVSDIYISRTPCVGCRRPRGLGQLE